jgi:hypothetical protein
MTFILLNPQRRGAQVFLYFKRSLHQCSAVDTGETLLHLAAAFQVPRAAPPPLPYCCPYPCPYCTRPLLTTAKPLWRRAAPRRPGPARRPGAVALAEARHPTAGYAPGG